MTLTASVLHDDGVALLALSGELDLAVVDRVDAAVSEVLDEGLRLLVLDLSSLTFCDSTGLGALLRTTKRVRADGGQCVVAGADGAVQRLLVLTGTGAVLTLVPDVSTALRRLQALSQDVSGS